MFDNLVNLGYGLVIFAIVVGVGSLILYNFGGAVGTCATGSSWNATAGGCWNGTDMATPTGTGYTNTNYLLTQLGSGGLAGWTPAIIAIAVGLLFLGAFAIRSGNKARY
jgi:hypothetical protein